LKSGVISRYRLFNVKTSKSPHAILDINEERRKWSFGSKTKAKNAWYKGNQNFQLALINTNTYFQIKTNQTESSKKCFTGDEKAEDIKLQHLLAKMYNKKAQIELTLLVMFIFVSCFPVGFNKRLETSQY
jgi:hypothetical protein